MWTMAAPAFAAAMPDSAICFGVTGTAGFLPGVSAPPVKAQAIITFRAIVSSSFDFAAYYRRAPAMAQGHGFSLLVEPSVIEIQRRLRRRRRAREIRRGWRW